MKKTREQTEKERKEFLDIFMKNLRTLLDRAPVFEVNWNPEQFALPVEITIKAFMPVEEEKSNE